MALVLSVLGIRILSAPLALAQRQPVTDSLRTRTLSSVTVKGVRSTVIESMPDVHGTYLMGGKRSEVIRLSDIDANVAEKTPR